MKKTKFIMKAKRLLSGFVATAIAASMLPTLPAMAEETTEKYPYTLFAGSSEEGAITVNAGNFCVNGNVATNGTIVSRLEYIADYTGGEFFKAYTADELIDIYTEVGINSDFDTTDTDGDGLYDAVEAAGIRLQNGVILKNNPETDTFYSNPTKIDTDGDGLNDGVEIDPTIRWRSGSAHSGQREYFFVMYSNPGDKDSDGDGIDDNDELDFESESHYSSPLLKDSDDDGIEDFSDPQPMVTNKLKDVNWSVWSDINMKEYMEKRKITEIVFKGVHEVTAIGIKSGSYHTSVIVIATEGSEYYTNSNFTQQGSEWSVNWNDIKYVTFGAGGSTMGVLGDLKAGYNRKKDVILDTKSQMINLSTTRKVNEKITMLFQCQDFYLTLSEMPAYTLKPKEDSEQNSNSYAHGLLLAAGIDDLGTPEYDVPGYQFPLESYNFGVE